jgi:hypothetical protein
MSDTIGRIAVLTVISSGQTFPLTTQYPFGFSVERPVIVHRFGSLDAKQEQRYYVGIGPRKFQFKRLGAVAFLCSCGPAETIERGGRPMAVGGRGMRGWGRRIVIGICGDGSVRSCRQQRRCASVPNREHRPRGDICSSAASRRNELRGRRNRACISIQQQRQEPHCKPMDRRQVPPDKLQSGIDCPSNAVSPNFVKLGRGNRFGKPAQRAQSRDFRHKIGPVRSACFV